MKLGQQLPDLIIQFAQYMCTSGEVGKLSRLGRVSFFVYVTIILSCPQRMYSTRTKIDSFLSVAVQSFMS